MALQKSTVGTGDHPGSTFERSEDYRDVYANNSQLASSLWELRIIFGQTEPSVGPDGVLQHTSLRLPWPQAKVLAYFLQLHILGEEMEHGRIVIGAGIIPELPANPPKELLERNPDAAKQWTLMRKHYDDFMAANPEAKVDK